jgi:hypothetical protein
MSHGTIYNISPSDSGWKTTLSSLVAGDTAILASYVVLLALALALASDLN